MVTWNFSLSFLWRCVLRRVWVYATERGFGSFCSRCIRVEMKAFPVEAYLERVCLSDSPCHRCAIVNVESSASAE